MKSNNSCPFCHISIAPFDPYRLVRNGAAAHEGCVKGKSQPGVYAACMEFLVQRGATFEASALEIKARSAVAPRPLAKVIATVLRSVVSRENDPRTVADVTAFAARMADRLYVDIDVSAAPAPRTNGASKAQHA